MNPPHLRLQHVDGHLAELVVGEVDALELEDLGAVEHALGHPLDLVVREVQVEADGAQEGVAEQAADSVVALRRSDSIRHLSFWEQIWDIF